MESMNGLQSNTSNATATTLTNNDIKGKSIDELANYFNRYVKIIVSVVEDDFIMYLVWI